MCCVDVLMCWCVDVLMCTRTGHIARNTSMTLKVIPFVPAGCVDVLVDVLMCSTVYLNIYLTEFSNNIRSSDHFRTFIRQR